MRRDKIKTIEEINGISETLREQNKTVVTCNGTFDILHIGHVKFLEEAKEQGDILIVGLNSDASVKENKGPKRPINNEKNRADMLAALECVDFVVIFNEKDPRELLSIIKPDVHVNGEEYGYNCIEAPVVRKHGGKVYIVHLMPNYSTTSLINKIKEM